MSHLMQNDFWTKAQAIRQLLSEPLHSRSIRNYGYRIAKGTEADLSGGCGLDVRDPEMAREFEASIKDFRDFLSVAMDVPETMRGYRIVLSRGNLENCPAGATEAFEISVDPTRCEITTPDSGGARRALIFLEDQMSSKRSPVLSLGTQRRWTTIADRITRSPIAAYRFKTGWELLDEHDYYPDEYLNRLAHCGINGIWVAGLFRTLIRTEILPELGPQAHRLDKLKELVVRAGRYGIRVHLFCIEPRSINADHVVLKSHPEIRGARVDVNEVCLCTSTPVVQEYIRQATCTLFTEVPELASIINIFNGERITNCWLSEEYARTCPRCSQRNQIDVLAEDLKCFAEGIRRLGSNGKCLAWNYWMNPDNELETHTVSPLLELIAKTDRDIVWLGNFEHGGTKTLCGREISIDEYSLSFTGPAEPFRRIAQQCSQGGSQLYAKLQLGTTFELSPVPYIPVPGIVFDKFTEMKRLGASGTMLNWIPGGSPSLMLKAAGMAAFHEGAKQEFLSDLARCYWPAECADDVAGAWNCFESSLHEYPFNNRFFYFGPVTRAPAYLLRLCSEANQAYPLNWGIDRHRTPQPFEEDFERWLGPFTVPEVIDQLGRMIDLWNEGLIHLEKALKKHTSIETERQFAVASVVAGHWRCTRNVIEFLVERRRLSNDSSAVREEVIAKMKNVVKDQIAAAEEFKKYIEKDPAIGYQSEILDFSYDPSLIDQAIVINRGTLRFLNGPEQLIFDELQKTSKLISADKSVPDLNVYGD